MGLFQSTESEYIQIDTLEVYSYMLNKLNSDNINIRGMPYTFYPDIKVGCLNIIGNIMNDNSIAIIYYYKTTIYGIEYKNNPFAKKYFSGILTRTLFDGTYVLDKKLI